MQKAPRFASTSLKLDGLGYASCGNPSVLQNLQSYTLEAWVNLSDTNGFQSVVGQIDLATDGIFQLYVQDGNVVSYYPTAPYVVMSPNKISANEWHHLATTYDSSTGTLTLYVDGVESAAGNLTYQPYTTSAPLLLGAALSSGDPTWRLRGMIGSVMIWSDVRSPEDILADSVQVNVIDPAAEPSLLLYQNFTYLPAIDESGNAIPLTLEGSAEYCLCVPSLSLSGSAYANCGNGLQLTGTSPYTIEGWFYPSGQNGVLVSNTVSAGNGSYQISYQDNQLIALRNSGGPAVSTPAVVTPGEYYHFAAVYNDVDQTLSLYLNGNLQALEYNTGSVPAGSGSDVLIGAGYSSGGAPTSFFQGDIQNIRFWNTALTQADIQQWIYNQPVTDPRLLASFDFTSTPPCDTTGNYPITLVGGAATTYQMITLPATSGLVTEGLFEVFNASYLNQQTDPPNPPPDLPGPRAAQPEAFSDAHREASWAAIEERLEGLSEERREQLRRRFEAGFEEAVRRVRENPRLLRGFTIQHEGGLKRLIFHGIAGDEVLLEVAEDETSDCILWWVGFMYTLVVGFLQALGVVPYVSGVATRVYNLLSANPTVVAAINTFIGKTITATAALGIIGVIYAENLIWPLIKLILTSAGWWTLWWVAKQILLVCTGAETAAMLANFVVWATQLAEALIDYPTACSDFRALPAAETAALAPA